MKRILLIPTCMLGVFLLCGCWNGRVLFSFEQPYWSTVGSTRMRATLEAAALVRGYVPRFDLAPSDVDPHERLSAMLSRHAYALAVVGPLLSFESGAFADRFPGTRFVLVDVQGQVKGLPPNVVTLSFDRTRSFREAGAASAAALKGETPKVRADGTIQAPLVGTISSADSDLTPEEIAAFDAGAVAADPEMTPIDKALVSPVDKAAIAASVTQMRTQGVEVFLLGLGSLNPSALDALRTLGGSAVIGDWQTGGAYAAQVLLSVEDDVAAGLVRALEARGPDGKDVRGPVRLVAGKAHQPVLPVGVAPSEGPVAAGKGKKI